MKCLAADPAGRPAWEVVPDFNALFEQATVQVPLGAGVDRYPARAGGAIGLGAGLIVPLFNVYFNKTLSASPQQIGVIFSIGPLGRLEGSGPTVAPSGRTSRFNRTTSPPMTSHRRKSRRVAFG